jgi:hypothetical protein
MKANKFIVYAQSNKGPTMLAEIDGIESVAFNAARHHAKAHGCVFMVDTITGKTERINAKGEFTVVHK